MSCHYGSFQPSLEEIKGKLLETNFKMTRLGRLQCSASNDQRRTLDLAGCRTGPGQASARRVQRQGVVCQRRGLLGGRLQVHRRRHPPLGVGGRWHQLRVRQERRGPGHSTHQLGRAPKYVQQHFFTFFFLQNSVSKNSKLKSNFHQISIYQQLLLRCSKLWFKKPYFPTEPLLPNSMKLMQNSSP